MIVCRLSVLVALACATLSPRSFGFGEQLDNPAEKGPAAARLDRYGDPLPSGAVARLGTQRWSTGELLLAAALSPDGTVIAASGNRSVWLLDAKTGKQVRRLEQDTFGRSMLAFSPDGKKLVVGDGRRMVIWDAVTGNKDKELPFQA